MQGSFCWYFAPRAVFLPWLAGPDAQHHGRYEPEGPSRGEMVVVIPVVPQRLIPTVLSTMVIPQLLFFHKVICVLLCVSCRSFQVVHMPVVCNDKCPGYVPQSQLINKVVYTPVVAQSLIPMAFLFSRPWRFSCCRTQGG